MSILPQSPRHNDDVQAAQPRASFWPFALGSAAVVVVLYGAWALVEETWFPDAVPDVWQYAYTARGALAAALVMGLALVFLGRRAREREAVETRLRADLQEQRGLLRAAVDSMAHGLVVADEEGNFLLFNRAAERILGLGPADIPKEEWTRHYGVYLPDQTTPYPAEDLPLARAIRGEAAEVPEMFVRHAGLPEGVWLSVTGTPLRYDDGLVRGGLAVFHDISDRKRAEEEIAKLNQELGRRVAELEAVNGELEAFSYSVSHDLRAPLRSIDGFSQVLLRGHAEKLDAQGQDFLQRVCAAAQRMGQLIDDLLNLSRLTRRPMSREPVDLSALARAVAAELPKAQPDRQAEFVIADGVVADGDPSLLRVVLENLLGNAWKYTGNIPRPRIEFGVTAQAGRPACFVRDDGAGFDMAYADKLFGAFQRLHRQDEFPGTGVGLATVQRIVHRHGGRVWAEAAVGRGATFYFTLS